MLSRWMWWGAVLGFALGGFFDGILLHQVLQWHHLLSLVPGVKDLRSQILWDGLFHVLMYVVAVIGLAGLWRARRFEKPPSSRRLLGALAAGFGGWNVVDAVVFHWVLRIHHIRLDAGQPLAWDLGWLAVFGVLPLLAAAALLRGGGPPRLIRPVGSASSLGAIAAVTLAAGLWAAQPPRGQPFTTVVFRSDVTASRALTAVAGAGLPVVWSDASGQVLVVRGRPANALALYRKGALLVGGAGLPAGCLSWTRA